MNLQELKQKNPTELLSYAEELVKRIADHGSINPDLWSDEGPWDAYHDGESFEERFAPFGTEWEREETERDHWR